MARIIDDKEKALLLGALYGVNPDEMSRRLKNGLRMSDPEYPYKGEIKNLSQMLLALQYKIQKTFHISYNEITFRYINEDLGISEIFWDLTKETLEEQSEETQRQINELLNN